MMITRKFRICLRRLRPSAFTSLCLVTSAALLTLGTSLSNRLGHHDDGVVGVAYPRLGGKGNSVQGREVLEQSQMKADYQSHVGLPSHYFNYGESDDEVDVRWKQQAYPVEKLRRLSKSSSNVKRSFLRPRGLASLKHSKEPIFSNVVSRKEISTLNNTLSALLLDQKVTQIFNSNNFGQSNVKSTPKSFRIAVPGRKDDLKPKVDLVESNVMEGKKATSVSGSVTNKELDTKNVFSKISSRSNQNDIHQNIQDSNTWQSFNISETFSRLRPGDRVRMNGRTSTDRPQRSDTGPPVGLASLSDEQGTSWRTVSFSKIVNGIYWSEEVESSIPKGVSNEEADQWIAKSRRMGFKFLQAPAWNKCGRPKNGFAVLTDGSEMCARYRAPNDRMLQGEILSYWLARLMSLDNVPPVSLSSVDSSQWSTQKHRFPEMGWTSGNHVALIMWIKDMDSQAGSKVLMPALILKAYKERQPLDGRALDFFRNIKSDVNNNINSNSSSNNNNNSSNKRSNNSSVHRSVSGTRQTYSAVRTLVSLAQWGSLLIFDYLTGNYDRVASMQDGAEREQKPSIIEESIRNLRKSQGGDKLWLIDNESGLLDAYDLLYLSPGNGLRFVRFHNQMLRTMCVFQRRVVRRLQALHNEKEPHRTLEKYAMRKEPMLKEIEKDSSYDLFEKHFSERLDAVIKWIHYCEEMVKKG